MLKQQTSIPNLFKVFKLSRMGLYLHAMLSQAMENQAMESQASLAC